MTTTDLIVIGAGPGGYRAAEYAAKQGLKVTIFEGSEVGGTCLNVGCIPTKTYVHSATFAEARERMAQVVPQLRSGVETILSHPNITLVKEAGKFIDANTVSEFTAPNIIIATGSETKWLPIKGIDERLRVGEQSSGMPRVVDSTGLLQLDTLPKRLAIIGAGVIGMEFASVFHRFGSEVTVIEYLKDDIDADVILMATGRKPRTEGLNLEAAGITLASNGAIEVNENYEVISLLSPLSSHLYAIGDVNGKQMLAHAAEMQAVRAVNHILGKKDNIRFDIMPAAIFTEPEAACVGPTEDQLKAQGIAYTCKKSFWRANGKAIAMNATEGMLKLFCDADGVILGCHAYGAHAADIVQEVSVLMCKHTTLSELSDMIHIHPTLSEILKNAVE